MKNMIINLLVLLVMTATIVFFFTRAALSLTLTLIFAAVAYIALYSYMGCRFMMHKLKATT